MAYGIILNQTPDQTIDLTSSNVTGILPIEKGGTSVNNLSDLSKTIITALNGDIITKESYTNQATIDIIKPSEIFNTLCYKIAIEMINCKWTAIGNGNQFAVLLKYNKAASSSDYALQFSTSNSGAQVQNNTFIYSAFWELFFAYSNYIINASSNFLETVLMCPQKSKTNSGLTLNFIDNTTATNQYKLQVYNQNYGLQAVIFPNNSSKYTGTVNIYKYYSPGAIV